MEEEALGDVVALNSAINACKKDPDEAFGIFSLKQSTGGPLARGLAAHATRGRQEDLGGRDQRLRTGQRLAGGAAARGAEM